MLADTIVPKRYREVRWAGLRRYLASGKAGVLGVQLELSALHREGHEFPVELTISVAELAPGQ